MDDGVLGTAILAFSVIILAVAANSVTRMAAAGNLGRQNTAGFRTRHTTASNEAWRAGHAAALPLVSRVGWIAVLTVAASVTTQWWAGGQWGIPVGFAGLMAQSLALFLAGRRANRAAQAVSQD